MIDREFVLRTVTSFGLIGAFLCIVKLDYAYRLIALQGVICLGVLEFLYIRYNQVLYTSNANCNKKAKIKHVNFEEALVVLFFLLYVFVGYLGLKIIIASSQMLMLVVSVIAMTDSAAYVFGKLIKGPKLCPVISPAKTISGTIFGVLGGIASGYVCMFLLQLGVCENLIYMYDTILRNGILGFMEYSIKEIELLSVAYDDLKVKPFIEIYRVFSFLALISLCAVLGDLIASIFKRALKIKDFGLILKGHGGVFDRLDSFIFCGFVVICCAYFPKMLMINDFIAKLLSEI